MFAVPGFVVQRKGGGGFFTHLNMKRRDGAADHNRQLTWLLHANKRLEEATIRWVKPGALHQLCLGAA